MIFTFEIPGEPVAQPRHRVGKNRKTGKTQMYIPDKHAIHGFKEGVKLAARCARPTGWDKSGPVGLTIILYFAPPKGEVLAERGRPHIVPIDSDNAAKAIMDALKGEVYDDDAQVYSLGVVKYVCGSRVRPSTTVTVHGGEDA